MTIGFSRSALRQVPTGFSSVFHISKRFSSAQKDSSVSGLIGAPQSSISQGHPAFSLLKNNLEHHERLKGVLANENIAALSSVNTPFFDKLFIEIQRLNRNLEMIAALEEKRIAMLSKNTILRVA